MEKEDIHKRFLQLQASAEKIGAHIHMLTVEVDYDRSYDDAAIIGCPQTPQDNHLFKIAHKYDLLEKGLIKEVIILFRWLKDGEGYKKAVDWGIKNGLRLTTPHVPFAISEHNPNLNYDLGPRWTYVVETTGCILHDKAYVCLAEWTKDTRIAILVWQHKTGDDDFGRLAFRL